MISDVIWHRLIRMQEKLEESKVAYDEVDEPALIAAMETIEQLAGECLRLARRQSKATGLRVVQKPIRDGDEEPSLAYQRTKKTHEV